jgi:TonB family protein
MSLFVALITTGWIISHTKDCGYAEHKQDIQKSEALVILKEPLTIPVTEVPHGEGRKECVLISFIINKDGRAESIVVDESSGSYIMNVSAISALKKYMFKPNYREKGLRYRLVFSGNVGAAPPMPPK